MLSLGMENSDFDGRDTGIGEDRLHSRKIGCGLNDIGNAAFYLLRILGALYVPDARRLPAASRM